MRTAGDLGWWRALDDLEAANRRVMRDLATTLNRLEAVLAAAGLLVLYPLVYIVSCSFSSGLLKYCPLLHSSFVNERIPSVSLLQSTVLPRAV